MINNNNITGNLYNSTLTHTHFFRPKVTQIHKNKEKRAKATSFAGRDSIFPALKHRLKLANRFSMQHPGAHTVTKLPATKDKTAAGLCLLGSYQTWTSPQVR